jgi:hypothetical protein
MHHFFYIEKAPFDHTPYWKALHHLTAQIYSPLVCLELMFGQYASLLPIHQQ